MKPKRVVVVMHADGHNDGGAPIVYRLASSHRTVMLNGGAPSSFYRSISDEIRDGRPGDAFLLEAAHPATSAGICAAARIAPQLVTDVVLIVDAVTFETDRHGLRLRRIAAENGATAVGLGNVGRFDPASADVEQAHKLGEKARALIGYIESYLGTPVAYVATSHETFVDRTA